MVHAYWSTILSVDDSVGRLRAWLEESGQLENTIIVFVGDNGLLEGEHGMVDKRTMHEPSIRIPMTVRYAGLIEETAGHRPAGADRGHGPEPARAWRAHGRRQPGWTSWVRLVRDGDPDWRKSWFYYYNYEKEFPYTPNVRGIRTEDWKYVRYPHGDGSADRHLGELYDLKKDPDEQSNLIQRVDYSATVQRLQTELNELMAATGLTPQTDKMPLDQGIKKELPAQNIR